MTRLHRLGITATITILIFCTAIAQNETLRLIGWGEYGTQPRLTFGGNVGFGTTSPYSKLEIYDDVSTNSPALKVTKNYPAGFFYSNVPAIYGEHAVDNGYGIGVRGQGGQIGVSGFVQSTGGGPYKGILGEAIGSGNINIGVHGIASNALISCTGVKGEAHSAIDSNNFGITGEASNASLNNYAVHATASGGDGLKYGIYSTAWGAGTNYAVYGSASAGDYNYAGYFASGNVYVADNVGIGTTAPDHKLTIESPNSTALRLIGPGPYGSTARFTFGDANNAYIEEDVDDKLYIYSLTRTAIMGGNVGIGTTSPGSKLEIQDIHLSEPSLKVTKNYGAGGNANVHAIYGENAVDNGYGIGVKGQGGQIGVHGFVQSTGSGPYKGILGEASGFSSNNIGVHGIASNAFNGIGVKGEAHAAIAFYNYGIRGEASNASFVNYAVHAAASGDNGDKYGIYSTAWGAGTNYAVYGSAGAGDFNYAGYFTSGNVYVQNNVGVGDLPDNYRLRVRHGTYGLKIQYTSSSNFWEFYHAGSGDNAMHLYTNVGYVGGFNYTTGAYTSVSDRRLKANIEPMTSVLSKVMKLQPSSYSFKTDADQKSCLGFIAQDVEQLFPQLVTPPSTDGERETPYTMDYSGFGVLAIKAIQEQQEIIDAQEERIAKLEAAVAELMIGK